MSAVGRGVTTNTDKSGQGVGR